MCFEGRSAPLFLPPKHPFFKAKGQLWNFLHLTEQEASEEPWEHHLWVFPGKIHSSSVASTVLPWEPPNVLWLALGLPLPQQPFHSSGCYLTWKSPKVPIDSTKFGIWGKSPGEPNQFPNRFHVQRLPSCTFSMLSRVSKTDVQSIPCCIEEKEAAAVSSNSMYTTLEPPYSPQSHWLWVATCVALLIGVCFTLCLF